MAENIIAGSINLANYMPETSARATAIAAQINPMNLDIIGFQETEEWLEVKLLTLLSGSWVVVSDRVNCPLFVRSNKYIRVQWKNQWALALDMPGSVRLRYGSAAMLRRLSDGYTFVAVTMHPSNPGESKNAAKDRVIQAEYVWKRLVSWDVLDFPILILGDMNDKSFAPSGLPGVFVKHGMVDVLAQLKKPATIDRAFTYRMTPVSTTSKTVPATVSDHPFRTFVIRPNKVPAVDPVEPEPVEPDAPIEPPKPPVTPPMESTLDQLKRIEGPIKQFRISAFEESRAKGHASQHTAAMQNYLNREVTCVWSDEDQTAYNDWRHNKFRNWPESRYTGSTDYESVLLLTFHAKRAGKQTHAIVR